MSKFVGFFMYLVLHQTEGVIYRLNESEYARMPPVYIFDNYDLCLNDPDGIFCTTKLALVSDTPSPLLDLIHEYTEDTKHFNHTLLYRGVCATHLRNHTNAIVDLAGILEERLNESLWNDYKLKARVEEVVSCSVTRHMINLTPGDVAVVVTCFVILLINIVGTLYDFICTSGKPEDGIRFLIYFSIRRNWRRLVAPPADGLEPRLKRLKVFYCVRATATVLVIIAHSLIPSMMYIDNTHYMENIYYKLESHIFLNGTVLVQSFFIMSGFLLAYNLQLYAEKRQLNWTTLPKGILLRCIRLSPPYAVTIALVCTWVRYAGSGPMWDTAVEQEVADCQRCWWHHLLFINNYIDGSQCFPQSWYLAADTQLYILGIIVCVTCKTTRSRKVVLSLLAVVGLVFPAAHTYFQDLNGVVIVSPKIANKFYVNDATYDNLYKRGHTNLFGYTLGLALGYIVYHLQQSNFNVQKYRKYRIIYWGLFPAALSLILLGSVFYRDGPRPSVVIRTLYATLSKPIFGIMVAIVVAGQIFKYENVYRGFGEWRGWTVPARLSYGAFLIHITFIRTFLGSQTTLTHVTMLQMVQQALLIVLVAFIAAVPLWFMVESPCGQLLMLMAPAKQEPRKLNTESQLEVQEVAIESNYRSQ